MTCGLAQTIQSARVTLGKLAELLTPEQIATVLNAFARERGQADGFYRSGEDVVGYVDSAGVRVRRGQVAVESTFMGQTAANALAEKIGAALAEAGRQALAGQIAAALAPFGNIQSADLEVEDAGVTRRATALRLTVGG